MAYIRAYTIYYTKKPVSSTFLSQMMADSDDGSTALHLIRRNRRPGKLAGVALNIFCAAGPALSRIPPSPSGPANLHQPVTNFPTSSPCTMRSSHPMGVRGASVEPPMNGATIRAVSCLGGTAPAVLTFENDRRILGADSPPWHQAAGLPVWPSSSTRCFDPRQMRKENRKSS